MTQNKTFLIVNEAMRIVSKDVRAPKVVREGIVKPKIKKQEMSEKQENNNQPKKLINLMDYNLYAWQAQRVNLNEPMLNGLACPECRGELMDSNPFLVLTSWPAQKNVHCSKCKYTGYRFV